MNTQLRAIFLVPLQRENTQIEVLICREGDL